MVLRGTLAERDPAAGIAVISGAGGDGSERAFRAGETVAGGIKLARVYPDRVILLRDGAEETLALTRDRNLEPGSIVRPGQKIANRNAAATSSTSVTTQPTSPGSAQNVRASTDLQQTLERLRQNPDELARRVQIMPVLDGGKLTGVRVSAGTDTALMNQIGLRAGDVVTAVNGAPVDSLARGQQIIESLRKAASARVTVMRDGKPTEITISLK
jgi:general secretion pathway protein C